MTAHTHPVHDTSPTGSADFTTGEGLRAVLHRLDHGGRRAWQHDAQAAELMAFTAEKYAPLARKHGLDPGRPPRRRST